MVYIKNDRVPQKEPGEHYNIFLFFSDISLLYFTHWYRLVIQVLNQSNSPQQHKAQVLDDAVPQLDYCDVECVSAWFGCGMVISDNCDSLQHRAAKLIFPHAGLHNKILNADLDLVPLPDRRKLHFVMLTKKFLDGLVKPYLNNYYD